MGEMLLHFVASSPRPTRVVFQRPTELMSLRVVRSISYGHVDASGASRSAGAILFCILAFCSTPSAYLLLSSILVGPSVQSGNVLVNKRGWGLDGEHVAVGRRVVGREVTGAEEQGARFDTV